MRPVGTTRAKKPIDKIEYERLMRFISRSGFIKQERVKAKLRRCFTLLYVTGCRISEIVDFDTMDLRAMAEQREYSLTNATKTKQSRLIILGQKQAELIRKITPSFNVRLFDVSARHLTAKANEVIHACLGELYSTHSFRAGYVTRLANSGANLKLIQEDVGHSNMATTARYIKVTDDQKRAAKERLAW